MVAEISKTDTLPSIDRSHVLYHLPLERYLWYKKARMDKIHVFDAIKQMRNITAVGGEFSFSYRKYDRQRKKGGDLVHVTHAKLRPKPSDKDIEYSSYKLFFIDMETEKPRQCWQLLITEFNGQTTYL